MEILIHDSDYFSLIYALIAFGVAAFLVSCCSIATAKQGQNDKAVGIMSFSAIFNTVTMILSLVFILEIKNFDLEDAELALDCFD